MSNRPQGTPQPPFIPQRDYQTQRQILSPSIVEFAGQSRSGESQVIICTQKDNNATSSGVSSVTFAWFCPLLWRFHPIRRRRISTLSGQTACKIFCILAFCVMITTVMEDRLNIAFPRWVCLPILVVVLCFATSSAEAHARLTKSLPDSGATLAAPPAHIDLWYNELLDGGDFNSITVFPSAEGTAATHTDLTAGKPTVDAKEPTHLSITLQLLPPGEYTVEWRVLSLDGHTAPGRFKFKVIAPKYQ
jgi:methionine-rich copper-binding protein CopC